MNYVLSQKAPATTKQVADNALREAREIYRAGKDVRIDVSEAKKSRTGQQNRYFWGLVGLIADNSGSDKDDIKVRLMDACGFTREVWSNGRGIIYTISTTKLNTVEFGALIEATQSLCEALQIKYPLPADLGMDFDKKGQCYE